MCKSTQQKLHSHDFSHSYDTRLRLDSDDAIRWFMADSPLQILCAKAYAALKRQDLFTARKILHALQQRGTQNPVIDGLRSFLTLEEVQKAAQNVSAHPQQSELWLQLFELQSKVYHEAEAIQTLQQGLALHPKNVDLRRCLVNQLRALMDYRQALQQVNVALLHVPNQLFFLQARAELAVHLMSDQASKYITALYEKSPQRWCTCLVFFLRMRDIPAAQNLLRVVTESNPSALAEGAKARLALWRGDIDLVWGPAEALINGDPQRPEGYFLRGAAKAFCGDQDGDNDLQHALRFQHQGDGWFEPSEAYGWLSDLAFVRGDGDSAVHWSEQAKISSQHYNPNAYLAHQRGAYLQGSKSSRGVSPRSHEVIERFMPLLSSTNWRTDPQAYYQAIEEIYQKIGGNRSAHPSWVDNGKLRALNFYIDDPGEIRAVQQHLRALSPAKVLQDLHAYIDKYPNDPRVYTHTGEIYLWLGDYEKAIQYCRQSIGKKFNTVWAWIGLGAAQAFQGMPQQGLDSFQEGADITGGEGPSVFVYRGEIHRKQGRRQQAITDLQKAIQHKPQRLSGWINRVLVDAEAGDKDPAQILGAAIRKTNPSLWWSACRQILTDPMKLSDADLVLESILDLMRGNRSSQIITYVLADGTLRCGHWEASDVPIALQTRYDSGMNT